VSTDRRLRAREADGFTLIEVMVALGLLVVVMTAALPAFLGMLRSTVSSKLQTQAKNLTQERLEQIRDLRYHIDAQNGPFLDLLDIYVTNAPTAPTASTVTAAGSTLTGIFVTSGAVANGEPTFPFYRTTTGPLAGATGFSQVVDAQFLGVDGAAIPAARYQGSYDSQVTGRDQAPSLLLGVTVITSWVDRGTTKTYRAYTRVTDGRPQLPVIQSQARAVAVDLTSTAADGTTLELQGGVVNLDGSQSSGSSVSGSATGALATRSGQPAVSGLATAFNLPTQSLTTTGASTPQGGSGCSWFGFGSTGVSDPGGDVSSGLPKAPADVDVAVPLRSTAAYIGYNGGGSCGQLSYDNTVGSGSPIPATSGHSVGLEMGAPPFARVSDSSTFSGPSVAGSGYVNSNTLTALPQKTVSGATASMGREVVLFPNNPESGGRGVFSAKLTYSSVDCVSATPTVAGTAVGRYSLIVGWWGRGPSDVAARWHSASWTYDSTASAAPVPALGNDVWDPSHTSFANSTTLSELITSPATSLVPSVLTTGATNGVRGFSGGILSVTTGSTLVNEAAPGYSAITLQLGLLTCVADDQR